MAIGKKQQKRTQKGTKKHKQKQSSVVDGTLKPTKAVINNLRRIA
jgi:hypothetical protein